MPAYTSTRAVFNVLREVCASPHALGVTEISRRLGMSASTAQRSLQSLVWSGFLSRDPLTPKYRIGFTAERLVNALLERYPIRAVALLPLRRLAVASHRTASLYIRVGWYSVRIAGVESPGAPTIRRRLGDVELLGEDARSLAILALLSETEATQYFRFRGRDAPVALGERIASVRRDGFAHAPARSEPDLEALAMPLGGAPGMVRAAVVLEGRSDGLPLDQHPQREQWQAIVREFESVLARKPDRYADPFGDVDPDQIRFGAAENSNMCTS